MSNYAHVCRNIKCSCGCEYCADCFALDGCPQCGKGKAILTTGSTTSPHRIQSSADGIQGDKQ